VQSVYHTLHTAKIVYVGIEIVVDPGRCSNKTYFWMRIDP